MAAWDVKAYTLDRVKAFADSCAVRIGAFPGLRKGLLMEICDAFDRCLERAFLVGLEGFHRSLERTLGDAEAIGGEIDIVEALGVFDDGLVAMFTDSRQDLGHWSRDVRNVVGSFNEGKEAFFKASRTRVENSHKR